MKTQFDEIIKAPRFNMNKALVALNNLPEKIRLDMNEVKTKLGAKLSNYVIRGLVRHVFFIELVKDDVSSTKFEVRWSQRLENDPRYSTYENCINIFEKLISDILSMWKEEIEVLELFHQHNIISYELPLDYNIRFPEEGKIHTIDNLKWKFDKSIKKSILFRKTILDESFNLDYKLFKTILNEKIRTKSYLTDRALTGEFKTNREKRWESHPNSVQFALRTDCLKIENVLLEQIARFEGTPNYLVESLIDEGILENDFEIFTCPITGDPINFYDFKDSILNKNHGTSAFQVGHMNPLKSVQQEVYGHTPKNISWISENGNRIQGSMSLNETEILLKRISKNKGWI
ncbi:hypothetical protein [Staphylococcus epidermidis]|uniref:hypothetical protein n=1 Tax=Staphylococcus epidermidis TaxID=1282 RepID=UPI0011A23382|nr:hypothetical protein [Staphylococcus epidermidis]